MHVFKLLEQFSEMNSEIEAFRIKFENVDEKYSQIMDDAIDNMERIDKRFKAIPRLEEDIYEIK